MPHEIFTNGGGILYHDDGPLTLGPSHVGGLTVKVTAPGLHTALQDLRQWGADLSAFFTKDEPGNKIGGSVYEWKEGDTKAFDITLAFNREIKVKPYEPPENLEGLKERIDRLVKPAIDGGLCPGMAVGVIYKGREQVWGYGKTSLAKGKTPDGDTEYEIGSITKLFTKLLFSDAVHRGLMGLQDKAQPYLPEGVKLPVKDGHEITLLMLSNHRSGLPSFPDDAGNKSPDPYGDYSMEKLYRFLGRCQLTQTPGEQFQYTNTGVALLGHFTAQKNATTWADLLRKKVLGPLGMKDTGVTWTPDELVRAAQGYDGDFTPMDFWKWKEATYVPAGALHSTVNDMLKLGRASLDRKSPPLAGIAFDETAKKLDWGPQVQHDGGTYGFNTSFFVDRENQAVLVVLGNCGIGTVSETAWRIRNLMEGKIIPRMEIPVFAELPASQLKQYAGNYRVVRQPDFFGPITKEEFSFFLKDGKLWGHSDKYLPRDLRIDPLANGNFYVRQQSSEMIFVRDEKGNVIGYTSRTAPYYFAEKVGAKPPEKESGEPIPPPE
jgi:serine-type D-Ala-D-Ala carboxypeptidase/endopeptidase